MKALLFANIGTDKQGYYHVGDEAIFLSAYNFYAQHFPDFKLTTLVSAPIYTKYKVNEEIGLTWPADLRSARIYYLKILFKTVIWRSVGISLYSHEQKRLVENIRSQNLIHFVGGGYLTNECGGWLYYALLVLTLASQFKIRTIMTSQTIGPFRNLFDRYLAPKVINKSECIMLRTKSKKQTIALRKMGITRPNITTSLDSAYFLPVVLPKKSISIKPKKIVRIGLSVHATEGKNEQLEQIIRNLIQNSSTKHRVELLILPHILHRQIPWDLSFMEKIISELPATVKIIMPNYYNLAPLPELAQVMKALTASCDLVIATRYHGVVFALSESVPCLTIVGNSYQYMKNSEALRFVFDSKMGQYLIDLRSESALADARIMWNKLSKNQSHLHTYMQKKNIVLREEYELCLTQLRKTIANGSNP